MLLEEISLLHLEQDHELEELQASLIQKSNDSCKDSFKNDLTNALTEIRKEHEQVKLNILPSVWSLSFLYLYTFNRFIIMILNCIIPSFRRSVLLAKN